MTANEASIRPFRHSDRYAVRKLWEKSELLRPWNDPDADIDRKVKVNPELFLVAVLNFYPLKTSQNTAKQLPHPQTNRARVREKIVVNGPF